MKERFKKMSESEKKEKQSVRLFEALGDIDPELLLRSEKKKKVINFNRFQTMAAAFFALIVVGVSLYSVQFVGDKEAAGKDKANIMGMTAISPEAGNEEKTEITQPVNEAKESQPVQNIAGGVDETSQDGDLIALEGEATDEEQDLKNELSLGNSICGLPLVGIDAESGQEIGLESFEDVRNVARLGQYVPALPEGWQFVEAYMETAESGEVSLLCIVLAYEGENVTYCVQEEYHNTRKVMEKELLLQAMDSDPAVAQDASVRYDDGICISIDGEGEVLARALQELLP